VRRIERRIDVIESQVVLDELLEAKPQDLLAALRASIEVAKARREASETGPL